MTRPSSRSGVFVCSAVVVVLVAAACGGTDSDGSVGDLPAGQETNSESGDHLSSEGAESGEEAGTEAGGAEESASQYGLDAIYDEVRAGARLVLTYDAQANAFTGTVENVTTSALSRVRVEVHLSNGVELGPTTPTDHSPGQVIDVTLPATSASFVTWSAHPEVGGGSESGQGGDESGEQHGNSESGEHGTSESGEGESDEHGGSD